jgi:hypothetical protein
VGGFFPTFCPLIYKNVIIFQQESLSETTFVGR